MSLKTNYQQTIDAIQNMDINLLKVLCTGNGYQGMPTDLYLNLLDKAFQHFKEKGDNYLEVNTSKCQGSTCQPIPDVLAFKSTQTNKTLALVFDVKGGLVKDIYQCYNTCPIGESCHTELLSNLENSYILDLANPTQGEWRKQNPYKEWEELSPMFDDGLQDIEKYSRSMVWKREDVYAYLNEHYKLYGFYTFYYLDFDKFEYRKVIKVYEIFRQLHILNQAGYLLRYAMAEGNKCLSASEKSMWLLRNGHFYFNLPIYFNEDVLCLQINGIDEVKLAIEHFKTPWLFMQYYKKMQSEVFSIPGEKVVNLPF